jgi:hypothetical protein
MADARASSSASGTASISGDSAEVAPSETTETGFDVFVGSLPAVSGKIRAFTHQPI